MEYGYVPIKGECITKNIHRATKIRTREMVYADFVKTISMRFDVSKLKNMMMYCYTANTRIIYKVRLNILHNFVYNIKQVRKC